MMKNEMRVTGTWPQLGVILREISQTREDKYCMCSLLPHMWILDVYTHDMKGADLPGKGENYQKRKRGERRGLGMNMLEVHSTLD